MKKNRGIVALSQLKIACIIGCRPDEREKEQVILVDLKITLPFPQKDSILETVDYENAAFHVIKCAKLGKFFLIETLAQRVADELLHEYPLVESVWVKVSKQNAVAGVESSYCEVEKQQK